MAGRSEDVVFHNYPPYYLRTRRRGEGTLVSEVTFILKSNFRLLSFSSFYYYHCYYCFCH